MSDDLAGALAGDAEFSPDGRDRRSRRFRTEAKYAAVREPTVIEARVGHGSVESKLVADPGLSEGGSETDGALARVAVVDIRWRSVGGHDMDVSKL
jgi:hypothetical protein